eukprot:COSAG02_NODE_36373_length_455_cov_1.016854_1_plen_28_part_10
MWCGGEDGQVERDVGQDNAQLGAGQVED